uniref:Glycoside hydrolase family 5 domain-containing protein n=1 Tax=Acrobeloides nanus TaxID=290746 RepID=A0A914EJN7_9BILA
MLKKLVLFVLFDLAFRIESANPPYGQLKITGTHVTNSSGSPVQLRGMSLYFSMWQSQFWNWDTVMRLRYGWNANIVRAPMGITNGGYLDNPEYNYGLMKAVIEAAINQGIYVIVDWHEEFAFQHYTQAIQFFTNISATYGNYPHIIYEIYNEPNGNVSWSTIKWYAEQVIPAIRKNDPNNIIVLGTPSWSSRVDTAADDPLSSTYSKNVAYTSHYYANVPSAQNDWQRNITTYAINKGLPIFITEYGTVNYTGNGAANQTESQKWWDYADQNLLSYCNWALDEVNEGAAALISGATASDVGNSAYWTTSGRMIQ